MKIRNCLYSLLITINITEPAKAAVALHAKVEEVRARAARLATDGYNDATNTLARKNTAQLLTPLADRTATATEAVGAHLRTELYYAFNTQWGPGKVRDHRIVYDFLSQLNKEELKNANQKEHLTVLTILSLAAQEYFWNEKSTVNDLKNRIKRELRYGLFSKAGHKFHISSLAYLDGINLDRIINGWINDSLIGKLRTLMEGFRAKTLGATYAAIFDDLAANLAGAPASLNLDLNPATIACFGVPATIAHPGDPAKLDLKSVSSLGDGICGEHSLFIPTDGGMVGIQEGNGRYKILRGIYDNSNDAETRRLYLLAS